MFRVRRIYDDTTSANREALAQVQAILRVQFPRLPAADVAKLPEQLRDPMKYRFRSILFVGERSGAVLGFALLLHAPDLSFCFLDWLSAGPEATGKGIGGALYERAREEALALAAIGLFFECLPDDPALSPEPKIRAQNAARLRFYERYGARPIANTAYETPIAPGAHDPPYLCFDDLGSGRPFRRAEARRIVDAILTRKYGHRVPRKDIDATVASFRDDPVRLREPRYVKPSESAPAPAPRGRRIALVVNDAHAVHHVRDRGYVQSPVRIRSILGEIERTGLFERMEPQRFADRHVKAVHAPEFVDFLRRACANVPEGKSVYPYVFPLRNQARPPHDLPLRAGYYCIDTFTPLNASAYVAARRAVDCALTGAQCLIDGYRASYALVRPPGHHAERASFGGFCYFNSAAVAAHFLSQFGTVALLDIDYHHGNGSQDIFYERADVLTVSTHGHPRHTYPYFSGYEDERGTGPGLGHNLNLPLPEQIDGERYRAALGVALERVRRHTPRFLIVSLGLDTARADPTGSWTLGARDFRRNGELIGQLGLPTLVVQEGGYRTRTLGTNARHFFLGLSDGIGLREAAARPPQPGAAGANGRTGKGRPA
jgi:acetoin utilization deacetylase AcuC-like enzyme/GNAT superfamily N-acetyltransferase